MGARKWNQRGRAPLSGVGQVQKKKKIKKIKNKPTTFPPAPQPQKVGKAVCPLGSPQRLERLMVTSLIHARPPPAKFPTLVDPSPWTAWLRGSLPALWWSQARAAGLFTPVKQLCLLGPVSLSLKWGDLSHSTHLTLRLEIFQSSEDGACLTFCRVRTNGGCGRLGAQCQPQPPPT